MEEFAKVATIDEIRAKDCKLSIPQYVLKKGVARSTAEDIQRTFDEWSLKKEDIDLQLSTLLNLI